MTPSGFGSSGGHNGFETFTHTTTWYASDHPAIAERLGFGEGRLEERPAK